RGFPNDRLLCEVTVRECLPADAIEGAEILRGCGLPRRRVPGFVPSGPSERLQLSRFRLGWRFPHRPPGGSRGRRYFPLRRGQFPARGGKSSWCQSRPEDAAEAWEGAFVNPENTANARWLRASKAPAGPDIHSTPPPARSWELRRPGILRPLRALEPR